MSTTTPNPWARPTTTERTAEIVSGLQAADAARSSRFGTSIVAHRSSRKYAEKFIASYGDAIGDTTYWNGSTNVPIHIEWAAVPSANGGFDVVSTVTPR
jgi:hypothetical protein